MKSLVSKNYGVLLGEIKERIRSAQYRILNSHRW